MLLAPLGITSPPGLGAPTPFSNARRVACVVENTPQAPGVGGFPVVPEDDDDHHHYGGGGGAAPSELDAPSTPAHSEPSDPSPVPTPRDDPPPPCSQPAETSKAGPCKAETRGKAAKLEKATTAAPETQPQARVTRSKAASASASASTSSRASSRASSASSAKEGAKAGPSSAAGATASRKQAGGAQVRVERAKRM